MTALLNYQVKPVVAQCGRHHNSKNRRSLDRYVRRYAHHHPAGNGLQGSDAGSWSSAEQSLLLASPFLMISRAWIGGDEESQSLLGARLAGFW